MKKYTKEELMEMVDNANTDELLKSEITKRIRENKLKEIL